MKNTEDELDRLLKHRELKAPEDFTQNIMSLVSAETHSSTQYSLQSVLQWLALGLGGVLGLTQSLYFLFGIWFATATG